MQFYFLQLLTISLRQNKYLRTNKLGRSTVIDIAVVERALHTQGCRKRRGRGALCVEMGFYADPWIQDATMK